MKFTNQRAVQKGMPMGFSTSSGGSVNNYLTLRTVTRTAPVVNKQEGGSKMIWGKHVWLFLHGISQKVKPEYFSSIKGELISYIKLICANLPCPDCSNHATRYLSKLDPNKIVTREDLVLYMYTFHNDVNMKKGYPLFKREELDLYKRSNLKNMYQNFTYYFKENYHVVKLMSENMHRIRVANKIESWLNQNTHCFEM
tara:strand:+ start:4804 stop:5397 length:594 start_codon:yes stop_codon:yes gene_type:complete